ncbi:MAG: hypothetical protein AAFQ78_03365, partial [Bacteroidota bacterium]
RVLQEAIVGRYYFQVGAIEAMLAHDQSIQRACGLLQNMEQYSQLLQAQQDAPNRTRTAASSSPD